MIDKNKRARDNRFQDWICAWLGARGWQTHNQKPASRMIRVKGGRLVWVSKRQDIFGCIDIIALRPEEKPLYIQATLDAHVGRKLNDIKAVRWPLEYLRVQLWMKMRRDTISVREFDGEKLEETGKIIKGGMREAQRIAQNDPKKWWRQT
jgi:hypothetical protein